jgi:hypothetical protein
MHIKSSDLVNKVDRRFSRRILWGRTSHSPWSPFSFHHVIRTEIPAGSQACFKCTLRHFSTSFPSSIILLSLSNIPIYKLMDSIDSRYSSWSIWDDDDDMQPINCHGDNDNDGGILTAAATWTITTPLILLLRIWRWTVMKTRSKNLGPYLVISIIIKAFKPTLIYRTRRHPAFSQYQLQYRLGRHKNGRWIAFEYTAFL